MTKPLGVAASGHKGEEAYGVAAPATESQYSLAVPGEASTIPVNPSNTNNIILTILIPHQTSDTRELIHECYQDQVNGG